LEAFCKLHGLEDELTQNIMLATDEAVTNIVIHAYKEQNGKITATFSLFENQLVIELTDMGNPFHPKPKHFDKPKIDLDGTREGGFGLYIIKKFVDELEYIHDETLGRNLMVLRKKITTQ
jgi:phosphoserine phosphatase RsbU/P